VLSRVGRRWAKDGQAQHLLFKHIMFSLGFRHLNNQKGLSTTTSKTIHLEFVNRVNKPIYAVSNQLLHPHTAVYGCSNNNSNVICRRVLFISDTHSLSTIKFTLLFSQFTSHFLTCILRETDEFLSCTIKKYFQDLLSQHFFFCQIDLNNLFSWNNLLFWVSDD